MGACASVPKAMLAEAGAAPQPEPPREETEVEEVKTEREVKAEEEKKPEEEKKVEEDNVKVVEDRDQNKDGEKVSLEALLSELQIKEVKEAPESEKTIHTETISSEASQKPEEQKTEAVPAAKESPESDTTTHTETIPSIETVQKPEEAKTESSVPIAKETPETPVLKSEEAKTVPLVPIAKESPESPVLKSEESKSDEFPVAHVVARVPMSEPEK